ncbi:hypothetical protein PO909_008612, partial [Leuciscus waleckii]
NETKVCAFVPSQELPHTPSVEPTDPLESRPTDRSFESLYEVGRKLKSRGDRSDYKGVRISDEKQVIIRCIKKSRPEKLVKLPGYPIPLSLEAAAMLMLQKSPTSTHIIQLYGMYILNDQDILVLECPRDRMTLLEFCQRNRGSLTEHAVKTIVQQLVVALQHCMDHGVYHKTHMKNVLINPNTLKVKLMDFGDALILEERRESTSRTPFTVDVFDDVLLNTGNVFLQVLMKPY